MDRLLRDDRLVPHLRRNRSKGSTFPLDLSGGARPDAWLYFFQR